MFAKNRFMGLGYKSSGTHSARRSFQKKPYRHEQVCSARNAKSYAPTLYISFGGPVQNTDPFQKLSVCILEADSSVFSGAYEISKKIFISRIPLEMELPVSKLITPQNQTARIFFGYSGWIAGQLENEILDGAWEISNPVPYEVFSKNRDEVPITVSKFRECYENHRI
jgi:putative AlgH/UPF0301 family transcriptional regulator